MKAKVIVSGRDINVEYVKYSDFHASGYVDVDSGRLYDKSEIILLQENKSIETIDDILNQLPKALYSGGLYMNYDMNGLWYCGYDKSVHHTCDRDLKIALYDLLMKLKENGY